MPCPKLTFVDLVCFPSFLIGGLVTLGWNENRHVCEHKAILADLNYKKVGCTDTNEGAGELVYFNCNLLQSSLGGSGFEGGDFASTLSSYVGTGIKVEAEMLQCIESMQQSPSGPTDPGWTHYNYDRAWRSDWVDPMPFIERDRANFSCGGLQSAWPDQVPPTGSWYVESAMADVWTLPKSLVQKIPLDTNISGTPPSGWSVSEGSWFLYGTGMSVGDMRIRFKGNNWNNVALSVLGKNLQGTIQDWIVPDDWLCSAYNVKDLRMGTVDISQMLEVEFWGGTWPMRFLAFTLAWMAFCFLGGPWAVDCIPCLQTMLGNCVDCWCVPCVSCITATACTMGVVGVVWLANAPTIGTPLIILFSIVMVIMMVWKLCFVKKNQKAATGPSPQEGGQDPETPANPGVVGIQDAQG
eukprot:Skav233571  [mRNA]  locus=scaffold2520:9201:10430:+ [translate_table: standard]